MFSRLVWILFSFAVTGRTAELQLRFSPQWGNASLAVPSTERVTPAAQQIRITRLAALLSDFQLLRPDGSVVRLEGQYGFIDAASGRLDVTLSQVPEGNYAGLQVCLGVPAAVNHSDPGTWPAAHALNPLVNGLHWSWQGGYVFFALEGFWRDAGKVEPAGFSYHLATDASLMTVKFLAVFEVKEATQVNLTLNVAALFKDRRIASEDGSDTTHSAATDPLAGKLARLTERALFWFGASPATPSPSRTGPLPAVAVESGTPLAFTVPAGFPQPNLPADNLLTAEGVELGRRLFFDERLSGNDRQSCASCHDPQRAFSDHVAFSRGTEGDSGVRNAMPLFNLAWHPAYAWDGTKKTIRAQALAAMANPIEMNARVDDVVAKLSADERVRRDFASAFGSTTITGDRIGRALEQFLLTLVSADSRFDRAVKGDAPLSSKEQRGLELFLTEYDPVRGKRGGDCFHCHGGGLFSDFVARSNGLELVATDPGAKNATGRAEDQGRFKTPSLRNVALTAPYMHDGRFSTLEEVVAHYDHGVQRAANLDPNLAKHPIDGLQLGVDEQSALVAFLRTLTDENIMVTPPRAPSDQEKNGTARSL